MPARRTTTTKWILIAAAVAVLVVLGLPTIAFWTVRANARERVVELLEERFDAVALESLSARLTPGPLLIPRIVARGRGLRLSLPGRTDQPAFLSTGELEIELSLLGFVRKPLRVRRVVLEELVIQIPPDEEEDENEGEDREPDEASSGGESPPPSVVVERLVADGTILRILPEEPSKTPLEFELHALEVRSAGLDEPMRFDAVLRNAKPPGDIRTSGSFGPLDLERAGETPLEGDYVFENADLSVFGGIAGTLYSEGRFGGVLDRIDVAGFTETPEFQLSSAGRPLPLRTEFEATVDGTNGDTVLHPVEAVLGESRFRAEGGVVEEAEDDGKTVCLVTNEAQGRIEDFLRLAMKQEPTVMTGAISFSSFIVIPPGDVDVARKLALDGVLAIEQATFPERKVQERVEDLSKAGRGADAVMEERVFSDIRGHFHLEDGVMTLTHLTFAVPGAEVRLEGTYGLATEQMDFRGELRLDAKLSETTKGAKSFFLKLVDPLFGRKDAGAVVPIKITGTAEEPSYGVEMSRIVTRKEVTDGAPPPGPSWPGPGASCAALERAKAENASETH